MVKFYGVNLDLLIHVNSSKTPTTPLEHQRDIKFKIRTNCTEIDVFKHVLK